MYSDVLLGQPSSCNSNTCFSNNSSFNLTSQARKDILQIKVSNEELKQKNEENNTASDFKVNYGTQTCTSKCQCKEGYYIV